ncbi:MAG: FecR family protein, partial [Bacteroidota bacterium]
ASSSLVRLASFEASPDYKFYQKIRLGTEQITPPSFDEDEQLIKLTKTREGHLPKKGISRQLWPYGIAAAIALLIGIFFFPSSSTTLTTAYGEQNTVTLPDGSEMVLNARSTCTFSKKTWKKERVLSLDGEALFRVKKGSSFKVRTTSGEVTVLGTIFNVKSEEDLLEVSCFEGKVSVYSRNETQLLTKGQAMRTIANQPLTQWEFLERSPSWTKNESTFRSIPAKYVLCSLEKQFDIQFEKSNFNDNALFSGSFPHNDLQIALKSVFGPLEVNYELNPDRTVILK